MVIYTSKNPCVLKKPTAYCGCLVRFGFIAVPRTHKTAYEVCNVSAISASVSLTISPSSARQSASALSMLGLCSSHACFILRHRAFMDLFIGCSRCTRFHQCTPQFPLPSCVNFSQTSLWPTLGTSFCCSCLLIVRRLFRLNWRYGMSGLTGTPLWMIE